MKDVNLEIKAEAVRPDIAEDCPAIENPSSQLRKSHLVADLEAAPYRRGQAFVILAHIILVHIILPHIARSLLDTFRPRVRTTKSARLSSRPRGHVGSGTLDETRGPCS